MGTDPIWAQDARIRDIQFVYSLAHAQGFVEIRWGLVGQDDLLRANADICFCNSGKIIARDQKFSGISLCFPVSWRACTVFEGGDA
jgi:hypothetical protein